MNWPNKNKKIICIASAGLIMLMAGFLFVPAWHVSAQTDPANTNSEAMDPADTDSSSDQTSADTTISENANLDQLNQALDEKRQQVEELKKQAQTYQNNIDIKQQEEVTLQNQLSLIDLQVSQAEVDIETVKAEIDEVNLEIEQLNGQIAEKTDELEYDKTVLGEYLRAIYKYDQKTYLEIFMSNASFSDFFDQMKYTEQLQGQAQTALKSVQDAKAALDDEKSAKQQKKDELDALSDKLSMSIDSLSGQKQYKVNLLADTRNSEAKFSELLDQANKQEQAAEAEMNALESKAREKLTDEGVDLNIAATLMWPVNPAKGISAYFHDPTYIFKKYFEHPAIDIPAQQGTAVRAADNGYVVRAKNAGLGYSYIMIVHNQQLSTVYGHISRIDVAEDSYVVRGQQIGLSGGTPGTPGAGGFTTGPHLHFEVRSNGIPVNPLDYLPPR